METRCPDTTDGNHIWDTFEVPSWTHLGDTQTTTAPAYIMRDCFACGEHGQAPERTAR